MIIPDELKTLAQKIYRNSGKEIYVVGGAVRDFYSKIKTTDYDITSSLTPDLLIQFCRENKIKYADYAKKYGTISIIIENSIYEHTTFRKDIETDGRKAHVQFSDKIIEDANRRDFTINAIYYNIIKDEFIDLFDGIKHIENKQLNFIGEADNRIKEDYLRIIRLFRFGITLDYKIAQDDLITVKQNISGISKLSYERIQNEMVKIYKIGINNNKVFEQMIETCLTHHDFFKNFSFIIQNIENRENFYEKITLLNKSVSESENIEIFYWALLFYYSENNYFDIVLSKNKLKHVMFARKALKIIKEINFDSESKLLFSNLWDLYSLNPNEFENIFKTLNPLFELFFSHTDLTFILKKIKLISQIKKDVIKKINLNNLSKGQIKNLIYQNIFNIFDNHLSKDIK